MGPPRTSAIRGADRAKRYDFHSHTFLTDGQNSATDLWHEAELLGHAALAVTDHVGLNDPRPLLERLRSEARGWEGSGMVTLVGVEVTHVRPDKIAGVVRAARRAGAEIVLVHGETLAEHVLPGTNRAALETGEVDVLAHPGLLSIEDAELARAQGTLLEISSRPGHSLANGLVVRRAIEVGARMVVDSDAHRTAELLTAARARDVAMAAGVTGDSVRLTLEETPRELLKRVGQPQSRR